MIKLTRSLQRFLWQFYREKYALIAFGHTELLSDDMWQEYLSWCKTDEGKRYLKGGSEYKEE